MRGVTIVEPKCFIFSALPNSMYYNRVGRRRRSVRTCATQSQRVTSQNHSIAVNKLNHHQVNSSKVKSRRCVAIFRLEPQRAFVSLATGVCRISSSHASTVKMLFR